MEYRFFQLKYKINQFTCDQTLQTLGVTNHFLSCYKLVYVSLEDSIHVAESITQNACYSDFRNESNAIIVLVWVFSSDKFRLLN